MKVNCMQCGKPTVIECDKYTKMPNCSISGKYLCAKCYGEAKSKIPETKIKKCNECNGSGRIKGYVCQTCDGKGEYKVYTGPTTLDLLGRGTTQTSNTVQQRTRISAQANVRHDLYTSVYLCAIKKNDVNPNGFRLKD